MPRSLWVMVAMACTPQTPTLPPPPPPPPAPALTCPQVVKWEEIPVGARARAALQCSAPVVADTIDGPFEFREGVVVFAPQKPGAYQATVTLYSEGAATTVLLQASARGWEELPPPLGCRADAAAPLLEQALGAAQLSREEFALTAMDLAQSHYQQEGWLDDAFKLPWFAQARAAPDRAGCFEGEWAGPLDAYLGHRHPAAGMIRHAARALGRFRDVTPAIAADDDDGPDGFDGALQRLCAGPAAPCEPPQGEVPDDLKRTLDPVLRAIDHALRVRRASDGAAHARSPDFWAHRGGNILILASASESGPDARNESDRAFLLGAERSELYATAAQLAYAIEDANWSSFAGRRGVRFELATAAGVIVISDGADAVHPDDGRPVLLALDLGGNDTWLGPAGANRSGANAVSVAIDLGGDDRYGYVPVPSVNDVAPLLPADVGGRFSGNATWGHVSLSPVSRQGAGRHGIGMLFDFGEGNDRYTSLRASQGYAHLGVGVLFDAGGNDVYEAEVLAQGAAQFGIGLAIDAGLGRDTRVSFTQSQGFGFVAAAGFLVDGGGDDVYRCDHGDPALGGTRLYYSPQLPTTGNTSLCQGAGFGLRATTKEGAMSGGLGVLRDMGGDDRYEASVYAQGTGYWQGTGLLADRAGNDTYDAYYYVQGAAAHYSVGILADGAGDDRYNTLRPGQYVAMGAGHDFSLGALIDESGNDEYRIPALAAGASNCNGVGVFVDGRGDDLYVASSDYGSGMGNISSECLTERPLAKSVGLMLDAQGADRYQYPASPFPVPAEGQRWGHRRNQLNSEYGAGLDGTGEAGIHVESAAP